VRILQVRVQIINQDKQNTLQQRYPGMRVKPQTDPDNEQEFDL